jgi:hypothetical protein
LPDCRGSMMGNLYKYQTERTDPNIGFGVQFALGARVDPTLEHDPHESANPPGCRNGRDCGYRHQSRRDFAEENLPLQAAMALPAAMLWCASRKECLLAMLAPAFEP